MIAWYRKYEAHTQNSNRDSFGWLTPQRSSKLHEIWPIDFRRDSVVQFNLLLSFSLCFHPLQCYLFIFFLPRGKIFTIGFSIHFPDRIATLLIHASYFVSGKCFSLIFCVFFHLNDEKKKVSTLCGVLDDLFYFYSSNETYWFPFIHICFIRSILFYSFIGVRWKATMSFYENMIPLYWKYLTMMGPQSLVASQ